MCYKWCTVELTKQAPHPSHEPPAHTTGTPVPVSILLYLVLVYSSDKSKQVKAHCTCCREYNEWKEKHLTEAELLQKIADMPCYYKVCDEQIKVFDKTYQGTICALCMALKGECI